MKLLRNTLPVAAVVLFSQSGNAQTIFSDTFSGASTLNQAPVAPTSTSMSYQTAYGLAGGSSSIGANDLSLTMPSSTSVLGEAYGRFTSSPVALTSVGQTISLQVVFVNTANILIGSSGNSTLNIGLFNSGGVDANQGPLVLSTGTVSGGTQNWLGYSSRIIFNGSSQIFTRPAQTPNGTTSQNQDLLFNGASGSQAYTGGVNLGSTTSTITLTQGLTYTLNLTATLTAATTLTINDTLYNGVGTGGSVVFTQQKNATGANLIATSFDGLAVGWRNSSAAAQGSTMDIQSIQITSNAVPEPSTFALSGLGMLAAAWAYRRQRATR
jgi:hypothetical protein